MINIVKRICLLFIFGVAFTANAEMVEIIKIVGNHRIENSTIKSLMRVQPLIEYNEEDLDKTLKDLLATDYFFDVDIKKENKELIVTVKENPTINKIIFEGNKRIKDDDLKKEISSNPRSVYTKTKLQNDVNRIIELYSAQGRYATKVVPKIVELDQNRIDLIFEIEEGVQSKISSITFVGNKVFGDSKLRMVINSEESKWYKFFSSADKYNSHQIEYDKELLSRFYKSKGYANFQVLTTVSDISDTKDQFFVTFLIEEGKKYSFGQSVLSTTLKIDMKPLEEMIATKKGAVYNIEKIDLTVKDITRYLNDQGFAFVNVDPVEEIDENKNVVNIKYQIYEGRKAYLRFINITGNLRTIDKVIRREIKVQEGDAYNATKINLSERNLKNLDYFSEVKITQKDTNENDRLDLDIEVKEKSTADLGFSGGYNTVMGPLGMITLRERNLFGKGKELNLGVTKAKKSLDFDISLTEPYFYDLPLSVGIDLVKQTSRRDMKNLRPYSSEVRGGALRAGYEVIDDLYHEIKYELETRKIYNLETEASQFVLEQKGKSVLSSIGHKFVYDKRDSKIDTSSGYLGYVQQAYAGIGGNVNYLKHEIGGAYYIPVYGEDVILELFGNVGNIIGLKGKKVKINDRFFLGADTLRGFDQSGVGPRAKICKNGVCSENNYTGDSIGGKNFYNTSIELKYPITDKKNAGVFGTFFLDAGEVFSTGESKVKTPMFSARGIRAAAGLGFGLITPMGPIKITYAMPIKKKKFDQTERIYITFKTARF